MDEKLQRLARQALFGDNAAQDRLIGYLESLARVVLTSEDYYNWNWRSYVQDDLNDLSTAAVKLVNRQPGEYYPDKMGVLFHILDFCQGEHPSLLRPKQIYFVIGRLRERFTTYHKDNKEYLVRVAFEPGHVRLELLDW